MPQTLVFVPSPLLFYGLEQLLADLPVDVHFLCVESDQKLMELSIDHSPGWVLRNDAITYLRTESVDKVLVTLHQIGVDRFRRVQELVLNAGRSISAPLYAKMYRAVEYEVQSHWRNRITLMHMAHLWIKNFFLNMPTFAAEGDVASLHIDQPIVVAGAGESLEGAVPLLKALRDNYFLLSVDTAVGSLIGNGLFPDAVLVLDAQSANLGDLVGFDAGRTTLISDITAYPACIRRFSGRRWFFFSQFASLHLFSRTRAAGLLPVAVPPLGSVGIAALYCAVKITTKPILFAGLDFSFRPGKSHARGAPAHLATHLRSSRLSPLGSFAQSADRPHRTVSDKFGQAVWTDSLMEGYNATLGFLLAESQDVYDIGTTGLPTVAPVLTDLESIRRVLGDTAAKGPTREGNAPRKSAYHPSAGKPDNTSRADARAFLLRERSRLTEAVRLAIQTIESGSAEESVREALRRAVTEVDYVYLHFPDSGAASRLNDNFLKRFVEAAETCTSWIDRSLSEC